MKHYIGIDIGGTKCAVVRGDENGTVTAKVRFPTATPADPAPDTSKPAEGDGTTAESETEAPRGGCKSALCGMAILTVAGAAVVVMKKKEE